jgi:hypothetical protein
VYEVLDSMPGQSGSAADMAAGNPEFKDFQAGMKIQRPWSGIKSLRNARQQT